MTDFPGAKWIASPNFTAGRGGAKILGVAIHIEQGYRDGTDAWFSNPKAGVSAHYAISRLGEVHQYVREADTAWHAGIPTAYTIKGNASYPKWPLYVAKTNPNSVLIGIENEGFSPPDARALPWTDAQYAANAAVIAQASKRWGFPINAQTIVRHGDVYLPKAALCPGSLCDMGRIIAEALKAAA